jgi:hypothetical protein
MDIARRSACCPPAVPASSLAAELLHAAQKDFHPHGQGGFIKVKPGVVVGKVEAPIGIG